MRCRLVLLLVSVACLCCSATAADKPKTTSKPAPAKPTQPASQPAAAPLPGDSQDVVYLGDPRPLLVRFHVQIDGKPYQTAWDESIKYLFKYLDKNGDGVLSKQEVEKTPSPQLLFNENSFYNSYSAPSMNELDANHDGKVTLEELAAYYRRAGGGPFHFQAGQGEMYYQDQNGQNQAPLADSLNDALFTHLDTNKDGKLSRAELAAMPEVLLTLDSDEDEMITIQELLPKYNQLAQRRFFIRQRRRSPAANSAFVLVSGNTSADVTQQLLARYGRRGTAGKKTLTRKQIGLDQAAFDELDLDKNGELGAKELDRFARRTPDLELLVRFGKGSRSAVPEVLSRPGTPGPLAKNIQKPGRGESIFLDLGVTRVELRGAASNYYGNNISNVRNYYKQQFAAADTDKKGFLDMKKARPYPIFNASFKMMDLDNDGKVTEKEMLQFLTKMSDLQSKLSASCASVTVSDQGRGLFDLIDTNKDSRLGVREMRNAQKLVELLDRDGDGQISRAEVPRNYLVAVGLGPGNVNNFNNGVFASPYGVYNQGQPAPSAGPLWFRKMDRNRDGDVSRKEFLGTEEEFRRIDTDGDGLISAQEADKADREFRKEKPQPVAAQRGQPVPSPAKGGGSR
jgi:Ca2+-binding EF-hand superfamily protein